MLTRAHMIEHHHHFPPMVPADRLHRFLTQPGGLPCFPGSATLGGSQHMLHRSTAHTAGTGANHNTTSATGMRQRSATIGGRGRSSFGSSGSSSRNSAGLLQGGGGGGGGGCNGQIVLTNWQVMFNNTPPDESEFNLIFNNHNLIDDDKLSVLSPPRSPSHERAGGSVFGLAMPPTPHTTVTYVDDVDFPSPTHSRSPNDTPSSEEVEIVRLTTAVGERRARHHRSDRRTPKRHSNRRSECNSNQYQFQRAENGFHASPPSRGAQLLTQSLPRHHHPQYHQQQKQQHGGMAVHHLTKPQSLDKQRRRQQQQPQQSMSRRALQTDTGKLIDYGMI